MAQCQTPFVKYHKMTGERMDLPCGQCPNCKARRVSAWSFRLMKESEKHDLLSAYFVTLTYNTDHVPISQKGFMSLEKNAVPSFIKRLRKSYAYKAVNPKTGKKKWFYDRVPQIRYYACGEYGTKSNRPHYHCILYNADPLNIERAWSLNNKMLGDIHLGEVTGASIGYVLKYMCKEGKIPMHKNDDRVPEFSLMSKRLGDNYLTKNMKDWHIADLNNRMYIPLDTGNKIALPRYYKERLYDESQRHRIGKHMAEVLAKEEAKLHVKHGEEFHKIELEKFKDSIRKINKQRLTESL